METTTLGTTGMKVSNLCLGTMQFGWSADKETSFDILDAAWDAGITFIDTADVYSRWADESYAGKSEEIIGEWLEQSGNRDELILATKVRHPVSDNPNDAGLSRRHINRQLDRSLERLQTDWIDLYQTHAPDDSVPIRSTLHTLTDLMADGNINAIGASNYSAWKLLESRFVSNQYDLAAYETLQPPYSLARRHRYEPDLMEVCQKYDISVIPYSPLSGGFLTGKYQRDAELPRSDRADGIESRYFNNRGWTILETLQEIASDKGITPAQTAVAWVLHQPMITAPIIGATSVQQLQDTIKATDISFSKDELDQLDEASDPVKNRIIY